MASSKSLFVTSSVQLAVGVGEIYNDWAKDIAGGGRGFGYGTEMTSVTGQLYSNVFSAVQYYPVRTTIFWICKTLELVLISLFHFPSLGEGEL